MKVLLYSRDEVQIIALQEALYRQDYSLVVSREPDRLFDQLAVELPDVILSNFDLPKGGLDLVNQLLATLKPPYPYVLFFTEPNTEKFAVDCLGPIPGDFLLKPFDIEEFTTRMVVAERIIALQENLRVQQELPPDVAMYDSLTNLLNRPAVYERVLGELNRAQREGSPSCLTLLDIANIDQVREKYGQKVMEQAMRFVARAIRANIRMYDIVGRWMDARFMLMLPGLSKDHAENVIGRIYNAVHSVHIRLEDDTFLELDVAAGYTWSNPQMPRPLYELVEEAGQALISAGQLQEEKKVFAYNHND